MPFWRPKEPADDVRSEWLDRVWPSPGAKAMKPRYPIGTVPTGRRRSAPRSRESDPAQGQAPEPVGRPQALSAHRGATVVELGRVPKERAPESPSHVKPSAPMSPVGRFNAVRSTFRSRIGVDGAPGPRATGGDALAAVPGQPLGGGIDWEEIRPYLTGLAFAFGVLAVLLSAAGFAGAAFRGVESLLNPIPGGPEGEVAAVALAPEAEPEARRSAAAPKPHAAAPQAAAPLVEAAPEAELDDAIPEGEVAHRVDTPFYFQVSHPDLGLASESVAIVDGASGDTYYAWNASLPQPIAGLTKLVAAMVYLDARPDLSEVVTLKSEDLGDHPKAARMYPGWRFTAGDLLTSIVVGSENPAVEALIRTSGIGRDEFMIRMHEKAQMIGMKEAFFYDPTGLDTENAASAEDLARLMKAVERYPRLVQLSRLREASITAAGRDTVFKYRNANPLILEEAYQVSAGKAGFTTDAGYCLASRVSISDLGDVLIVLLGAPGKAEALSDLERVLTHIRARRAEARDL